MARALLGPLAYAALALGPAAAGAWALSRGAPPALVAVAGSVGAALLLAALEALRPHAAAWRARGPDVPVDATHLAVGAALGEGLRRAAVGALAAGAGGARGPWPAALPFALQVVLALVLVELVQYAAHRALHRVPWLWRFHAVHHSPARLYWLNTFRSHPLDTALTAVLPMVPLVALGASEALLVVVGLVVTAHGMLQHANVRVREGLAGYVFSTAALHRWHHSRDLAEAEGNYGGTLIVWDLALGTRVAPAREGPAALGLAGGAAMPERYLAQLAYPFRPRGGS